MLIDKDDVGEIELTLPSYRPDMAQTVSLSVDEARTVVSRLLEVIPDRRPDSAPQPEETE